VIERRSKGAFDTYSSRVFDANRGAIREMLLNGALARQSLIDTVRLEAVLARDTVSKLDVVRLLELTDVEAWVDAWASRASGSIVT
jgi:asparagine synthase (glutamine-hydrolysing)